MLIFVHGGVPGVTPYVSGPHIWGRCLELFRKEFEVSTVNFAGKDLDSQIEELSKGKKAHLVGHDIGGLVALSCALKNPGVVQAVTAVSSVAAAPTGDGVDDFVLAHPPLPKWSRASQAWALERVSYSRHHIDEALLDACVAAAKAQPAADEKFGMAVTQAKTKLFETFRGEGLKVPVQVVWGSHDPLATVDQGLWLYRLAAQQQRVAQFDVIQRTGALPFREEPEAFHQIVAAFHEGIS
jgi:pimeloyl-ACP methyl ester carboxylesterase